MTVITKNIEQIIYLCSKYKVKSLYAFGSVLTESFNNQSDVDHFNAVCREIAKMDNV